MRRQGLELQQRTQLRPSFKECERVVRSQAMPPEQRIDAASVRTAALWLRPPPVNVLNLFRGSALQYLLSCCRINKAFDRSVLCATCCPDQRHVHAQGGCLSVGHVQNSKLHCAVAPLRHISVRCADNPVRVSLASRGQVTLS